MGAFALIYDPDRDATVDSIEIMPPPSPVLLASSANNPDRVLGFNWATNTLLTLSVNGVAVADPPTTGPDGGFFRSNPTVDLAPGDVVVVSDGVSTRSLTLVGLSIDAIDYGADTASGTSDQPDGTPVEVNGLDDGFFVGTVTAVVTGGTWTANFAIDLTEDMGVFALIYDPDRDATVDSIEIIPPPPNSAPVADPNGPYAVTVNETVSFDGSGSSDPDMDTLTYTWTAEGGTLDAADAMSPTFTPESTPGTYNVTLFVTDEHGMSSSPVSTTVVVSAPALSIDAATILMTRSGGLAVLSGHVEPGVSACPNVRLLIDDQVVLKGASKRIGHTTVCAAVTKQGLFSLDTRTGAFRAVLVLSKSFKLTQDTVTFALELNANKYLTEKHGHRQGPIWTAD
jgi:hypothetical protein